MDEGRVELRAEFARARRRVQELKGFYLHGAIYLIVNIGLLTGSHAETREAYSASEGFFAVADRKLGEGLRLLLDHEIFYEFVPVEEIGSAAPHRHWVGNVEIGRDYALAISTAAGL